MLLGAPGLAQDWRGALGKASKGLDKAKKTVDSVVETVTEPTPAPARPDAAPAAPAPSGGEAQRQEEPRQAEAPAQQASASPGRIMFSKSPINPASPDNLTTSFKAGDTIYGLILPGKPWREVYKAGKSSELGIMVAMLVNESDTYQYITLKKGEYIDSNYLTLDIAPSLDQMTAYRNPDIQYGEGKGRRKIGPVAFTYELGRLPAGRHVVECSVRHYGDKLAVGSFEIEGDNYAYYTELNAQITSANDAKATLPPAQMVNKSLEAEMRALLENAGWTNILRIVIVDKDWWIVDNGRSRYLNVAAAAKGADGQCYWHNLQFTQPRLLSGDWGKLELTRTGDKRFIAEENVLK